jgi:ABC-type nitrate/sulfonate/bicarbonate transport system permease component
VISGLRVGTSLVVIGVVVSEMLASVDGVGFWISYHRTLFNTGHVYLGISLALVCVLIVNGALSRMEKHFGKWRDLEAAG